MLNRYKKILFVTLVILSTLSLLTSCKSKETGESADASGDEVVVLEGEYEPGKDAIEDYNKSETVTASGDATGSVKKITVETVLSGFDESSGDYIEDKTLLYDIKNKEGAEEFLLDKSGALYWQNLGDKITYEGKGSENLPVEVKVSYYLNGVEKTPEEMAGASGSIKIRYDFENVYGEKYIPFACVPVVMLDDDVFENIEITGGKLVSFAGNDMAVGMCVPGLGEYLSLGEYDSLKDEDISFDDYMEITADTEEFKLDFSAVIVKNSLTDEIASEDIEDVEEIGESLKDLGDAGDKLADSAVKLASGSDKFKSSLKSYVDGVSALADGIGALDDSLSAVDVSEIKKQLSEAMAKEAEEYAAAGIEYDASQSSYAALYALAKSMEQVKTAIGKLDTAAGELKSGGDALYSGYTSFDSGIEKFESAIKKLNDEGLKEMSDTGEDISSILKKIRRLKKYDKSYDNYGGSTAKAQCDVTFIIELDGI